MNNKLKRTHIIVPLIVVLMLISIIAVICVGAPFGHPSKTAELNRDIESNKEQISAETTTLNGEEEYIVPEDGLYRIEVYGGSTSRNKGQMVTEVRHLLKGVTISMCEYAGGKGGEFSWGGSDKVFIAENGAPGVSVMYNGNLGAYVSGAPGGIYVPVRVRVPCPGCGSYYARWEVKIVLFQIQH